MNTIGNALTGVAQSSFNPFNYVVPAAQNLFGIGDNAFTQGLGDFLSLAGPGALAGGLFGGQNGALIGGGLGGLAGLTGLGGGLNIFGSSGPLSGVGNIFSGGSGGGLFGSGGLGGALGGLGGALGGAGGLGDIGSLLAGGIPLAFLTNEANKASKTPTSLRTPFSRVVDGNAVLDPAIRGTFMESIGNTRGMLDRARGNQNAFIQARVNPMEAQVAQQRGALERSLGQRGVAGSSFGDQAMRSFGLDSERALGDARSQATQEALGFESSLNQLLSQGGSQLLAQELAALGLSQQNIAQLLERAKMRTDLFGRAAGQFGNLLTGGA